MQSARNLLKLFQQNVRQSSAADIEFSASLTPTAAGQVVPQNVNCFEAAAASAIAIISLTPSLNQLLGHSKSVHVSVYVHITIAKGKTWRRVVGVEAALLH